MNLQTLRSARGGIRTHDLLLRRQALYPAELRTQTRWDRGGFPSHEHQ